MIDENMNMSLLSRKGNGFFRLMDYCALLIGICVIIAGSVTLYGWLSGNMLLTSFIPNQISIKVNTAIAFLFIGVSLLLQILYPQKPFSIKISRICSAVLILTGLATSAEYLFNINLGIDQLLVKESGNALFTSHPGRMAFNTAAAIFFIGAGFYLNTLKSTFYLHRILVATFGSFVVGLGTMAIIGYYSGIHELPIEWNITLMAVPTAFLFIVVGALLIYFAAKMGRLKIALDRQTISWFSIGVLILAFISILSYRSTIVMADTDRWVTKTNTVLLGIRTVLSDLKDAETGQRGYLITGFERYLLPYYESTRQVDNDINHLRKLIGEDILQQKRIDTLKTLTSAKLSELKRTIDFRRSDGFEAAQRVVLTNQGQKIMEEIRALLNVMIQSGNLSLEERQKISDFYVQNTLYTLPVGAFFSVFFLLAALLVVNREINSRKKAEEELQRLNDELEERVKERTAELTRSNKELEQFAYVASHDLQEPLRMVASYTQLLSKRYKGKLDSDADEFINYAVDGASRMQRLINDLLSYSRVKSQGRAFGKVNLESALRHALSNLKGLIEESGARITHDKLPVITGDETQIVRLFQNLIDNAIKYHGEVRPEIHISARSTPASEWVFSVKDNGIGIDPVFNTKIFEIFERLHGPVKYSGTGIGLAICKRIVERHGGNIWVESKPGDGATFYFTIKKGGE